MGRLRNLGWEAVAALVLLLGVAADAARILAVMPVTGRSHHIAISAVTRAMAERGHDVTYFTGLPQGNKINPANNKVIHVPDPNADIVADKMKNVWNDKSTSFEQFTFLFEWGAQMANNTLHSAEFKAEVNKPGQKYDLIMVEAFFCQEALVVLGHKFNAPVVAVNPFGTAQWINDAMGNPVNPSWVPSPILGFSDHMSFFERAINTLSHAAMHLVYYYYHLPKQQAIVSEHFPDAPPLQQLLWTRLDLALVNNHFSLAFPAPMSPNVVEIGGIQVPDKPKPLPQDLQTFLDGAKEGVVYFSMGSNVRMEYAPEEKKAAIFGALSSLKQKVLLKWDGPAPKNLPPHIRVIEWAPQGDLLAHPNVRVFVTHGGLLSTQESIHHGVPVVGIPLFGDQRFNMGIAKSKGWGVTVDFLSITQEALQAALKEVLENPRYKQSASKLSRLFRSRPQRPAEAAVWAVEHLLQHGGAHLRPASVGMPAYKLLLLDVLAAVLAPLLAVWLCCRALCCRRKAKTHGAEAAAGRKKKTN